MKIVLPDKIHEALDIDNLKRYNVLYGGRGGAKSWGVATVLPALAYAEPYLILCAREIQNTIRDSVHKLISDRISALGLDSFFSIQRDQIIGDNGSKFIFKGLRHNIAEIKSTEGIDICWVEEAQSASNDSWRILIPTIRKKDSKFFITFNPDLEDDPTFEMFVNTKRPDVRCTFVNYYDNPYFPEVLRAEMEWDKENDYEKYLHVWEGQPVTITEAQVFKGKYRVDSFETPEDAEFHFGSDWGFSNDPATLVRTFISDQTLFIDYEAYGIGVDIDELPQFYDSVPKSRDYKIYGDPSRPDTISYLRKRGFRISGAKTGSGSIEDGIAFMRSFKDIVIHSRCIHAQDEFKLYSYKTDKYSGEILPIIVDKHNHIIDAVRYGLSPIIKAAFKFVKIGASGEIDGTSDIQLTEKVSSFGEAFKSYYGQKSIRVLSG